eukprot:GHUV01003094.1.p1 GENE.GHUV01003094.1~~GHUV01003094.1.p1  ORF type:complete len:280 (+),score=62.49 GHUV01003094.1:241-1080(+)
MLHSSTRQVCHSLANMAAPRPACHSRAHVHHPRYGSQQSMAAPLVSTRQAKKAQNMCPEALSLDHAVLSNGNGTAQIQRPLRVLIAGAGIGGLVLAVALLKKGCDVFVFERDMTAIRGEGKYRGPIQVQSNALAALEAIDVDVCNEVLKNGCITGDRINGLCDGETGDWYIKFDTFHPAVERGLPVTRVISRITLQEILADATERLAGKNLIENSANVVGFEEVTDASGRQIVRVTLEDGRTEEGDILIGADGIWSKVCIGYNSNKDCNKDDNKQSNWL